MNNEEKSKQKDLYAFKNSSNHQRRLSKMLNSDNTSSQDSNKSKAEQSKFKIVDINSLFSVGEERHQIIEFKNVETLTQHKEVVRKTTSPEIMDLTSPIIPNSQECKPITNK